MDSCSKYESFEIEQDEREQEGTDPIVQNENHDLENFKPNNSRSIGVKMIAIFIYILGILSFTLMSVTWKMGYYYNANLNAFDYMLVRSIAMIVSASIPLILNKVKPSVRKENHTGFLILISCATISMITNFVGLKYVSTMKAVHIMNLMPIFISILGVLCLKEIINRNEIIWIIGAFFGVWMMVSSKADNSRIQISYYFELFSSFLIVISWFLASVWFMYIRVFNQNNSPFISPFYYALILFILSMTFLIFYPSVYNFDAYTFRDISLFLISGIWNSAGNTLSSYASKLEKVSTLAPFGYIGSVFAFTSDLFIFRYSLSILEIVGALLVISFLLLKIKVVEQSKSDMATRNQEDSSKTSSKN